MWETNPAWQRGEQMVAHMEENGIYAKFGYGADKLGHAAGKACAHGRSGFTLAELLIVVAIVSVLVVIAIPVFSTQLEASRESTDSNNERLAKAAALTEYLGAEKDSSISMNFDANAGKLIDTDPTPYGQGTETGDVTESHVDEWIHCEVSADGVVTLAWTGGTDDGTFSGTTLPDLASNLMSVMNSLLKTGKLTNGTSASYQGTSYTYSDMGFNYGYTKIGDEKLGTLLANAGLTTTKLSTLKDGNARVYYTGSTVTGVSYTDPSDSSKLILLFANGSMTSIDKTSNIGYIGSLLAAGHA